MSNEETVAQIDKIIESVQKTGASPQSMALLEGLKASFKTETKAVKPENKV